MKRTTSSKRCNYVLEKLKLHYSGTSYCNCFEPPWLCPEVEECVWKPESNKSKQFTNAVNTWIDLSKKTNNLFIKKQLYEWLDMNHANILAVDRGLYPVERFFPLEKKGIFNTFLGRIIMEILPPCKNTKGKNKILHLLSKACPKRCQIRNLKEIVLQYATEDDQTYLFLLEVMKKSLLGKYNHCKVQLQFEGRHVFYQMFSYQISQKSFFLKWFENGNHQIFLFFCLKEYLCDAVRQVKTVYDYIEKHWKWSIFDKQVVKSMDNCRKILNTISEREYNLLHVSDWISSIESFLLQVSKQHIKLFRTTNAMGYISKLKVNLNKYIISEDLNVDIRQDVSRFLWEITQRTTDKNVFYYALEVLGLEREVVEKVKNEIFCALDYKMLSPNDLFTLKEFCRVIELHKSTYNFVLPKHYYDKQVLSLKKRENKNNQAIGYICFICNDIKFFLTKLSDSSRHSNKLARGSLRVVVDNDISCCHENNLKFVCGKKPERHVKNSKKKWKNDKKALTRKLLKEKQRNFLSKQCIQTPLQEIDLLGHAIQFNNKMIMLCSSCGNVCMLDPESFKYSVNINCKVCHVSPRDICIKCNTETTCNKILVYNQRRTKFHKAPMCNNCTNVYAQKQPVVI
ncbi:MAG: hypothetical protein CMO44_17295 [Verrucomicrobiales bacterium]|nr:hypothetical protein [Verrucomicrobiales bacterium]